MKTFLEYVAEDILAKHGTNLARIAVVFPNKRASLFLNDYLARKARQPIWSPAYITISDLFRRHSTRTVADPVKLVCDLYKSFAAITGTDETLDHFYGWGQLLLADFDDIDKNMADADRIFSNLRDIHELDDTNYLSPEQREAIRRFFSNFADDHNTVLKERFLRLWSNMGSIYHDFNSRLSSQNLAYEGALYRDVATRCGDIDFSLYDTYIFVGFNLLQRVEQQLFAALQREGKARFYWDFDHSYMKQNEAGHFIAQHLADFPCELDTTDDAIYRCSSRQKRITFVAAPTENIQARFAATWLREHDRAKDGRQTAIVMCNENLLPTIIHCLPGEVERVNITTGYSLAQTPAASLISLLIALRTQGYDRQRQRFRLRHVNTLLRHPYISYLSPQAATLYKQLNEQKIYFPDASALSADEPLALLFGAADLLQPKALTGWLCDVVQAIARNAQSDDPLFQEAIFRTYTLLNRLQGLIESGDLQVDIVTLQRLIGQLIQQTSIPFHGEPAEGLQVMGVLETRNLDFRHVLLLSCNEGNIPRGVNDASVIPYSLRRAYGLTTIDHKVAIYSYYFHRLLQRADDVTITYNNATTDGQRGEMSRFMLQLMVESSHAISFETLQADQQHQPFMPPTIDKDAHVVQTLMERFAAAPDTATPRLTPTAINRYQRCPLTFYYNYVMGLREPDTNDDDTIDNRIFGNIFHEASHQLYKQMMGEGQRILPDVIDHLLHTKTEIERAVDNAFRTELFQIRDPKASFRMELNGLQLINREVIIHYLRQLLTIDRQLAPFDIIGLETDVVETLTTPHITTTIGGRIDRLDQISDDEGPRIRVIDYKTGASRLKPLPDVEAIFDTAQLANHSDYYLQTLLYATIVSHQQRARVRVSPALLFIQHARGDDYDPTLSFGPSPITDIADESPRFLDLLTEKVTEIFDPAVPFTPTADRARCNNCPYRHLCG